MSPVDVHLVDGTYELYRHYFAVPPHVNRDGQEVSATRGVLASVLNILEEGATHVGVATDHVVESFRNDLYAGYKTGEGIEPTLRSQFELLEEVLAAAGFAVWPMVSHEADDAMGTAAAIAERDPRVGRAFICTPDKDLAQCVVGDRVVQRDRRKGTTLGADGIVAKFGVKPTSIPDYLGLVGDSADGFPGLPGWGAKSAATVLARYEHIEDIPDDPTTWEVKVRGAAKLGATLAANREDAMLFRRIATLDFEAPGVGPVDSWLWEGPKPELEELCDYLENPTLVTRAQKIAASRARGGNAR